MCGVSTLNMDHNGVKIIETYSINAVKVQNGIAKINLCHKMM